MTVTPAPAKPSRLARLRQSDLWWSFSHSWSARFAAVLLLLLIGSAFLAPLIAPQNPYDAAQLDMWKSELPPLWQTGGEWPYLLGTDTQGRDMLSVL
ncbi:MAG: ABC transporter permease, partial [Cereibacter changlensis]